MQKVVESIVQICIREDLVNIEDLPWLRYGLEKRICTLIVGIPFLLIAFAISNPYSAVSFFLTYLFLRKYTGGYHSDTMLGCVVFSLIAELLFLGVLRVILSIPVIISIHVASIAAIYILAPHNHINLHLSSNEIAFCKRKAKTRVVLASLVVAFAYLVGWTNIANGCTSGIAMTAALLCLGYIKDWRKKNYEYQDEKHGKKGYLNDNP